MDYSCKDVGRWWGAGEAWMAVDSKNANLVCAQRVGALCIKARTGVRLNAAPHLQNLRKHLPSMSWACRVSTQAGVSLYILHLDPSLASTQPQLALHGQ